MSQEVKKKRRKSSKRKKRIRLWKKILMKSAISIALLTAAALLAVFVISKKTAGREAEADPAQKLLAEGIRAEKEKNNSRGIENKDEMNGNIEGSGEKEDSADNENSENHKKAGDAEGSQKEHADTDEDAEEENLIKNAGSAVEESVEKKIRGYIEKMSIKEKIAQLFVITPEGLTNVEHVVMAGETTRKALNRYPVGGLAYFKNNINSEAQFVEMVKKTQAYSIERTGLPLFICVDEEGGSVTRISGRGFANVPDIPDMRQIGAEGDSTAAYEIGVQIGEYLSRFQVNVDFAPIADIFSNPKNTVIGSRAFGSDPKLAADMAANVVRGLKEKNIASTLKHFPGHGDTAQDSHSGWAYSYKSLEELRSCELIPFQAGIDAGAEFVMAGHISLPNVLGDNTPASLSYKMITEVLRGEMGFSGIVITDALNMGAISENYSSAEAVVRAVQAGVDMLLMSRDFESAYMGLLDAVEQGKVTEDRIDASLRRILKVKLALQ